MIPEMGTLLVAIAMLCNYNPHTAENCQKQLSRCVLQKRSANNSDRPQEDLLECVAEGHTK